MYARALQRFSELLIGKEAYVAVSVYHGMCDSLRIHLPVRVIAFESTCSTMAVIIETVRGIVVVERVSFLPGLSSPAVENTNVPRTSSTFFKLGMAVGSGLQRIVD